MVSRELAVFSVFFIAMAYGQSYGLTEVSLHFLKDFFAKNIFLDGIKFRLVKSRQNVTYRNTRMGICKFAFQRFFFTCFKDRFVRIILSLLISEPVRCFHGVGRLDVCYLVIGNTYACSFYFLKIPLVTEYVNSERCKLHHV